MIDRLKVATDVLKSLLIEPEWEEACPMYTALTDDFPEDTLTLSQRLTKAAVRIADDLIAELSNPVQLLEESLDEEPADEEPVVDIAPGDTICTGAYTSDILLVASNNDSIPGGEGTDEVVLEDSPFAPSRFPVGWNRDDSSSSD